ncbi:unnamed protein product [Withania somnifera]
MLNVGYKTLQVFCLEHRSYNRHHCPTANKNDVTVVFCPLCAKGCDPSNYEKTTKKQKCPVPGCREILTFSNTIKCRQCTVDHCLKHRFGPEHNRKDETNKTPATSSCSWATTFFKGAEAGMAKLGSGRSQSSNATNHSGSASGQVKQCPQCTLRFSSVTALVSHVQKAHEKNDIIIILTCPKCSKGFHDQVSLLEHVEREHTRTSKA